MRNPALVLTGITPGPVSGGSFLGIQDTSGGATKAIPLVSSDCDGFLTDPNRLLATFYDVGFGNARGWTAPDARLENRTLRSLPFHSGNGVYVPIPLPGTVPPNPAPPTLAEPTDPISIGRWLEVNGDLVMECRADNTAFLGVRMSKLIPNGVYTMWGHWADTLGNLNVAAIGGLPNVIVADKNGDAEYCREIPFCFFTGLAPDGSSLEFVTAMYNGNGDTFGAVPYQTLTEDVFVGIDGLPFQSTMPGGITTFDHVGFRVRATGGPDPGSTIPVLCMGQLPQMGILPLWGLAILGALIVGSTSRILARRAA